MKKITVIIPTFNREHSVIKAIDSSLKQSGSFFVEVIVVDDGSTDNTELAIQTIFGCNVNVKYVKLKNGGACRARNTGIKLAESDFVALLDSDDVFLPNHLASALDIFEKDAKTDVYFSRVKVQRGDDIHVIKPTSFYETGENMSEYLFCKRGFVPTITLVLRTDVAKSILYDESLMMGQDTDFAIRLYFSGKNIHFSSEIGAIWFDYPDPNRVSNNKNYLNRIEWHNRNKNIITSKARRADFGWHIAKGMRAKGLLFRPLILCLYAIFTGSYSPKLSVSVFLQVFLSKVNYRKLSDFLISKGINP